MLSFHKYGLQMPFLKKTVLKIVPKIFPQKIHSFLSNILDFSISSYVDFSMSFTAVSQKGHNDNFWRDRISYSDIWACLIFRPIDVYVFKESSL